MKGSTHNPFVDKDTDHIRKSKHVDLELNYFVTHFTHVRHGMCLCF